MSTTRKLKYKKGIEMFKLLQGIVLSLILLLSSSFGQAPGAGIDQYENRTDSFLEANRTFSGTDGSYFYSTTTYTFGDLVVFSYFDNSNYYVYTQDGTKIDSVSLQNNEFHVFSPGVGIFSIECTNSFTVLVGDPVTRNVLGFYAVDESGSPLSTRLNTYMPSYMAGDHFIVFGYHEETEYVIKNLQTSSIIAAGILDEGEHFQLDGFSNTFIGVEANKPVSALSYNDQGYFIPATNGTFAGTHFYGFSGYVGNWSNGVTVTGYTDSTHFLIMNSTTGDTVASGVINEGEAYAYVTYGDLYYSVVSDEIVTVSNTPYANYSSSYYYMVRQIDESGLGIGTNFYAPAIGGDFDVFSFDDENTVTITAVSTGIEVWSGVLNTSDNYRFTSVRDVYHVLSTKNISVITSWGGGWGADFVPLSFTLSLPDVAVASSDIQFLPETEVRTTGEMVTIKATVRNQGHETAQQVRVQLYDGDPKAGIAISNAFGIASIAPGASADVQFDWVVPEHVAYHNIYVEVDKWDQIRESNESNNIAFKSLIANDDLLPPLSTVVEGPTKVFVDDQNVPEFDTFKINVDLFNTGTVSAINTKATLILPAELVFSSGSVDSIKWASVEAGAHVDSAWTVQINSIPSGNAFFYSVLVEADDIESKVVERMMSIQTPTAIKSDDKNYSIPEAFKLSQNFPNPFNPDTRFQLELTETSLVKIAVYDITGRQVAQLEKGMKIAGTYSYSFNGGDLVSGIYFLGLELNNQKSAVRKMILVK